VIRSARIIRNTGKRITMFIMLNEFTNVGIGSDAPAGINHLGTRGRRGVGFAGAPFRPMPQHVDNQRTGGESAGLNLPCTYFSIIRPLITRQDGLRGARSKSFMIV
jgi:hypothetical protein